MSEQLPLQAVWIRRLARKLVHDDAAAEDVAQEVALAALRKERRAGVEARHPGPWLARVTANLARRSWRASDARVRGEKNAARDEHLPATDETLAWLETQRLLVEELERLDEPFRSTLIQRFYDGWSAARIARASGVPASTVRWRIQHALGELRARLDRRGGGDGIAWRLALLPLVRPGPLWAGPFDPGAAAVGLLQGVLGMKLSMQVVTAGAVFFAIGVGILLQRKETGSDAPATKSGASSEVVDALTQPERREAVPTSHREPIPPPATSAAPSPEVSSSAPKTLVDGRCVDRELAPVAGARILGAVSSAEATRSSGNGTFVLECAPEPGKKRRFRFEAEGFGTRLVEALATSGETTHLGDVVLLPGGTVRGHVRTSDGAPVAGAVVTVTETPLLDDLESARRHGPPEDLQALRAEAEQDGSFRIEGVTAGMVRVWASAPGMLHALSGAIEVPVHAETEEIELVLEPLARLDRIAGIVLDPEGQPVAGASGMYIRNATLETSTGKFEADEHGRFEFSAARESTYDLYVGDPEERWLQIERMGVRPGTDDLELAFAESSWIDVTARAQGQVVTEYALFALELDGGYASGSMKPEVHSDGRASLRGATKPFRVQLDAPGYALASQGPFEPTAPPSALTFELEPEPGVRGRVLAYGEPVSGARVSLHGWSVRERIDHAGYPALQAPYDMALATSDAEGRYVLSPRSAGTFVVRAQAPGLAPGDSGPLTIDLGTGLRDVDLVLTRGGAIEGRVLLAPGRDPAGVIVAANRGDAHPRTTRTEEDGRFVFEGLTPGPWHVARGKVEFVEGRGGTTHSAQAPAVIPFNCEVFDGQTTRHDIDLSDAEPCRIQGRLSINGAPASGWLLAVQSGDEPVPQASLPSTATGADGAFALEVDDAGPASFWFQPPAEESGQGNFSVDVRLVPGANPWKADFRTGRLEGSFAVPPGADELFVYSADESVVPACWLPITADAEGRFVLPYVSAGRGSVKRLDRGDSYAWVPLVEVEVTARATQVVEVP